MSAIQSYTNFFGTMARSFRISKGGPTIIPGTEDPNTAAVAGNPGDLYILVGSAPDLFQNTNGSNWRSVLSAAPRFVRTPVTSATYSILASDSYIGVNYAGTVSLFLPEGISGALYSVKDESGNANANPITIVADGSDTIDGQSSFVLSMPYGAITLGFDDGWHVY